MRAHVVVLAAIAGVGAHEPLGDRRQRRSVVEVDRGHLGAAEHVVVQHVEVVDLGSALRAQALVGGALAGVLGLAALAGHLVGAQDRHVRGHQPERRIGMPEVVALLVVRQRVRLVPLGVGVDHVADGAEELDPARLAEDDMVRLRLAEAAGERQLRFVGHLLVREVQQRMRVDGLVQRGHRLGVQRPRKVQARHPRPEIGMDRLERQHELLSSGGGPASRLRTPAVRAGGSGSSGRRPGSRCSGGCGPAPRRGPLRRPSTSGRRCTSASRSR